jgi:hypothetical protein
MRLPGTFPQLRFSIDYTPQAHAAHQHGTAGTSPPGTASAA